MGGRKARARPKSIDPVCIVIGWAPPKAGGKPFDVGTLIGNRMRDLAGRPLERFTITATLHEQPTDEADYDAAITPVLRRRATAILQECPLLPVLAVGRLVARTLGIDGLLGRDGFLHWSASGTRQFAVLPAPSPRNRWWSKPENAEAARLFMRELAGGAPLSPSAISGASTAPLDLDELERVVSLFGCPPAEIVAAYFKISSRTFYRRLEDPEVREAWDRGRANAKAALYRARFEKAIRGGHDGLGDPGMQRYLSATLLGERIDDHGNVRTPSFHLNGGDDQGVVITRHRLREVIRTLNAKYQIRDDVEIVDVPALPEDQEILPGTR